MTHSWRDRAERPIDTSAGETRSTSRDEAELLRRLRNGDATAFGSLVDRYHTQMIQFALTFVSSRALAEEVAQDTWLGLVRSLDRFEGRCSLQTWIYKILANRARTTGVRARRTVAVGGPELALGSKYFTEGGSWAVPPVPWTDEVDDRLSAPIVIKRIHALIEELPDSQRQVVTLRDVQGLSNSEVCEILGISEGNQRVLLHRARTWVRKQLEEEVTGW